jgi:hypothetical protein
MVTCDMIKDLLPLYVENMLSKDSQLLVESHLKTCPECQKELELLKSAITIPIETNTAPLLHAQRKIQKNKWQIGIFSTILTLIIATISISFLTSPQYLPYNQEKILVSTTENDLVVVQFDDSLADYHLNRQRSPDGSGYIYHLTTWNNSWHHFWKSKERKNTIVNPNGEKVTAVYYYPGSNQTDQLIYGENIFPDGGMMTLPRLVLAYYLIFSCLLMIIGGIGWLIFHRKQLGGIFKQLSLISFFYILSHLFIKGMTTVSYSVIRDFTIICLLTLLLYSGFLLGNHLFYTTKQRAK